MLTRLKIFLVKNPRNFTYEEIITLPKTSKVVDLNCVEGKYGYKLAKWIVKIELVAHLIEDTGIREDTIIRLT